MGHAQNMLASYRKTLESNQPKPSKFSNG